MKAGRCTGTLPKYLRVEMTIQPDRSGGIAIPVLPRIPDMERVLTRVYSFHSARNRLVSRSLPPRLLLNTRYFPSGLNMGNASKASV